MIAKFSETFPRCRSLLGPKGWQRLMAALNCIGPDTFPEFMSQQGGPGIPPFLPGLARIELARHQVAMVEFPPVAPDRITLNPTLQILASPWKNMVPLINRAKKRDLDRVVREEEYILVWRHPRSGGLHTASAEPSDLLAIKLVVEESDPSDVAREAGVKVGIIDASLREAIRKGLLCSPPSKLRREVSQAISDERFASAEVFTLQWHLTQECDLHCRHCYDRTSRRSFPIERALTLLDELGSFCRKSFVRGQVSLTGGNPLMYPHFFDLYRAAAERDFMIAVLGNAVDRAVMERLVAIRMPVYYQVSLEGLERHNDEIRGAGNYQRTVRFLRMLTDMGIPNMVMLTLTRSNLDQVIPLAEQLEGITGGLTFNRLALFGEGTSLELPVRDEYLVFLERYVKALADHPVLTLKDNLLNCIFEQEGSGVFGGCTGFGCGAAFNFLSLLSDGEVHACRKFPSPLGNILNQSLEDVYNSEAAHRYRAGSSACNGCTLRPVCGGCMAVTASLGLDPFNDKDPFCPKTTG